MTNIQKELDTLLNGIADDTHIEVVNIEYATRIFKGAVKDFVKTEYRELIKKPDISIASWSKHPRYGISIHIYRNLE